MATSAALHDTLAALSFSGFRLQGMREGIIVTVPIPVLTMQCTPRGDKLDKQRMHMEYIQPYR